MSDILGDFKLPFKEHSTNIFVMPRNYTISRLFVLVSKSENILCLHSKLPFNFLGDEKKLEKYNLLL